MKSPLGPRAFLICVFAGLNLSALEAPTNAGQRSIIADADYSYIGGYIDGYAYGLRHVPIDLDAYMQGFRDVINNVPDRQTYEGRSQAQANLNRIEQRQMAAVARENKAGVDDFLAKNAQNPAIKQTASGLQYRVLTAGKGPSPSADEYAVIEYTARSLKGEAIQLWPVPQPVKLTLDPDQGAILTGIFEGVKLMNAGAEFEFFLRPELALGLTGMGPVGPGEVIIVKIKLLSFSRR